VKWTAIRTIGYEPDHLDKLSKYMDVRPVGFALGGNLLGEDEMITALAGVDIFIVCYDVITRRVIEGCPDLKLIASTRGGPDANIDIDAATAAGIPVLYAAGRNAQAVAEYVVAFMLAMARPIYESDRQTRAGILMDMGDSNLDGGDGQVELSTAERDVVWPLEPDTPAYQAHQRLFGTELYGKTLGLIGFGVIGQTVARVVRGFCMRVLVCDPYLDQEEIAKHGAQSADLTSVMSQSDYISLHARLTPGSVGMIGQKELRAMKPTACLINTARAALVDEDELLEALREGWFRAAGLDVHHEEPIPLSHPIFSLPPERVVLSPHLAGSTKEVVSHHSRLLTEALTLYFKGERLNRGLFNPRVFENSSFAKRGGVLFGSVR
jgi:phosphoglycerate dehydrogenase-like enzyme